MNNLFLKTHISDYDKKRSENNKPKPSEPVMGDIKARNHCHETEEDRRAGNVVCNLTARQSFSNSLPIEFLDRSNYDPHLFSDEVSIQKKATVILRLYPKLMKKMRQLIMDVQIS